MDILIVGGGIGGLTTALTLAKKGFRVKVFEKTPGLTELGAGIQLSPNCSSILDDLGLGPQLKTHGISPESIDIRQWETGEIIYSQNLKTPESSSYCLIHRGDLLSILTEAATEDPLISISYNSDVQSFDQNKDEVWLERDGIKHRGELLIGADGIHSAVRKYFFNNDRPQRTKNIAWRFLVPSHKLPTHMSTPKANIWWGSGKHIVHYPVRSGKFINCVCIIEKKSGQDIESWENSGDKMELKEYFSNWNSEITAMIEEANDESCYKWALYHRKPTNKWVNNRVVLLGDACHPALPFLAQGAAMAIEDAQILASSLSKKHLHASKKLDNYKKIRFPRTKKIQFLSNLNSKIFHLSGIFEYFRNRLAKYVIPKIMTYIFNYRHMSRTINEGENYDR